MREWPPLHDAFLIERLRAHDDELVALLPDFLDRVQAMPVVGESYEERRAHGLQYPWPRPTEPCIVSGDEVRDDGPLSDDQTRYRLLAFGSNGNPQRLAGKFHDLAVEDLRIVPGHLHGFDVCALPTPSPYMSLPAGIAPSPGTIIEVSVLEVTAAQFERLTLTEFGYWPGRLEGITLETADGETLDSILAYNQRMGLYAIDGAPVALDAIPARGRTLEAMSQEQLLAHCARRTLGPSATSDDLCHRLFADPRSMIDEYFGDLRAQAVTVELPGFVRYPLPTAELPSQTA